MNKSVYIQNSKFEWLECVGLGRPIWVSDISEARTFDTFKEAKLHVEIYRLRDVYVTSMTHLK